MLASAGVDAAEHLRMERGETVTFTPFAPVRPKTPPRLVEPRRRKRTEKRLTAPLV